MQNVMVQQTYHTGPLKKGAKVYESKGKSGTAGIQDRVISEAVDT